MILYPRFSSYSVASPVMKNPSSSKHAAVASGLPVVVRGHRRRLGSEVHGEPAVQLERHHRGIVLGDEVLDRRPWLPGRRGRRLPPLPPRCSVRAMGAVPAVRLRLLRPQRRPGRVLDACRWRARVLAAADVAAAAAAAALAADGVLHGLQHDRECRRRPLRHHRDRVDRQCAQRPCARHRRQRRHALGVVVR